MKKKHSNRNLYIALVFVVIIVAITLISASNIGFRMTRETVASLPKDQMVIMQNEDESPPFSKGLTVQTITATNSIIPRRMPIGPSSACLYNSQTGQGVDVSVNAKYPATIPMRELEVPSGEVIDIGIGETKTVALAVMPYSIWVPKEGPKPRAEEFDTLYLFISEKEDDYFYPQCYDLPEEHKAMAIRIPLV